MSSPKVWTPRLTKRELRRLKRMAKRAMEGERRYLVVYGERAVEGGGTGYVEPGVG
jgi:hypothetical protein